MNRLEIRGVIVPSFYDSDWTKEYIEKGLIIPESTFRRMLMSASVAEPLEIYINSPGGSVFAAYEMVNAVKEWKAANAQPVNIVIGAMAASAASMFAVSIAGTTKAHQNAKMMFHGAVTDSFDAGKDAHEDTAALLGKINAGIQQVLIQRYKMDPETVAAWFAEGRQGWLTAQEMLDAGIIGEIIADDAEPIVFDAAAIAAIEENGLDIAAVLEVQGEEVSEAEESAETEEVADDGGKPDEGGAADDAGDDAGGDDKPDDSEVDDTEGEGDGAPPEEPDDTEGSTEGPTDAEGEETDAPDEGDKVDQTSPDYAAGVVAGRLDASGTTAAEVAALTTRTEAAEAESRKHQGIADRLRNESEKRETEHTAIVADLTAKLNEAQGRLTKFVDGSLKFSPEPRTWAEAMQLSGEDYAVAAKKYPALLVQYRNEQKERK